VRLKERTMGKVTELKRGHEGQKLVNEDVYRDSILSALTALRAGDTMGAERHLLTALEDVETVLAGGAL